MTMTVLCVSCGRKHGHSAFGMSVNAIGCTGACLHWAIHAIDNPPFWHSNYGWDNWEVSDEDATCIELICSDVNALGVAMLSHVQCGATVGHDIYLDEWIETLQIRYEYFLAHAKTQEIDDTTPRLPGL